MGFPMELEQKVSAEQSNLVLKNYLSQGCTRISSSVILVEGFLSRILKSKFLSSLEMGLMFGITNLNNLYIECSIASIKSVIFSPEKGKKVYSAEYKTTPKAHTSAPFPE